MKTIIGKGTLSVGIDKETQKVFIMVELNQNCKGGILPFDDDQCIEIANSLIEGVKQVKQMRIEGN